MTFEFYFFFFSFRVEIIRPHYNHKENLRIITCPQLIPKNDPPKNLTLYLAGHVKNLSSVKMAQNPPIMWAQDHEHVFVTIKLHDVIDEEIKFHSNGFYFKGKTKKPEQTYETTFTLFNEILTRIEYMIRNMDDLYSDSLDFLNDELLPILEGIVLHEQTIVPKVILIPNLLSSLMENNPYPIVELVSKILKIFSFRFSPHITPKGLQKMLISPILDIIDTIIEHFNIDARFAEKDSGPDHHDDFQGLITLLEILFLLIQIDECVKTHILGRMIPFVYQNIHHFETGSIIAVLAHQDPTILFDDLLFMRWTTSAQNKVYLSSVESILKSTEKPKFEFFIPKMIYYAFVSLFEILSEGYVSDENDEFFNMDSIKNFFTPDSLVNYTNPYLIEQFLIYHNKLPNNKQEDLNDFDFKGEEAT